MTRYDYKTRLGMPLINFLAEHARATGRPQTDLVNEALENYRGIVLGREAEAQEPPGLSVGLCAQCGRSYADPACGPDHAVIAHEQGLTPPATPDAPRSVYSLEKRDPLAPRPEDPLDVQIAKAKVRLEAPETYAGLDEGQKKELEAQLDREYRELLGRQASDDLGEVGAPQDPR